MKAKRLAPLFAVLIMMCSVLPALAVKPETGNGSESGHHYNLNIIGVPNQKNTNFNGGQGSRIFVLRTGSTMFYVHGGDSYQILDHDGTDGKVGEDRLNPGIIFPYDVGTGSWRVKIYVRLLGPKTSSIKWKSSYWNGTEYVLFADFSIDRDTPSKFSLKTGQLLMDQYQDILWEMYDKTDFRILQMRIYLLDE